MRALLALSLLTGWASYYDPGPMQATITARQQGRTAYHLSTPLPESDGYAAVLDCSQIGNFVWARPYGAVHWDRLLVVDCAGRSDWGQNPGGLNGRQWMIRNNILLEVDARTMRRWAGRLGQGIKVEMSWRGLIVSRSEMLH